MHLLVMWLMVSSLSPHNLHFIIIYYLRVFHIHFNWWYFTGIWVIASLLKSRWIFSILAVLCNVVVWMVSTHPPTSESSSSFKNPLVTVPKTPNTSGIIVTFMFQNFFNSLARSKYLSFFSLSFSFILWTAGTSKSTILQVLFFCWLL